MTEAQEWMHLNSTHSSTELIDCMGSDKTVVHSARVSYANDDPLNSMLNDKDEKLINYLAENDVNRISSAELATIFVKESREVISPNAMAKELRNLGLRETRSGNAKKFEIKKLGFVD